MFQKVRGCEQGATEHPQGRFHWDLTVPKRPFGCFCSIIPTTDIVSGTCRLIKSIGYAEDVHLHRQVGGLEAQGDRTEGSRLLCGVPRAGQSLGKGKEPSQFQAALSSLRRVTNWLWRSWIALEVHWWKLFLASNLQEEGIHVRTLDGMVSTKGCLKFAPVLIGLWAGLAEVSSLINERSKSQSLTAKQLEEIWGVARRPARQRNAWCFD